MTLLVVGCTSATPHGRHALGRLVQDATARGVELVGVDTPHALATGWCPPGFADTAALDWRHETALEAFGRERAGTVDGVLTHREQCVYPTAILAQSLGVRGNPPEAVQTLQRKDRCRELLRRAGLAQPVLVPYDGPSEMAEETVGESLGLPPWVVKPRVGQGSAGVHVVRDPSALARAVDAARAHGAVLVEQFVDGAEFSAEGVMVAGEARLLAFTRKRIDDRCVERGHRMPAGLTAAQEERVRVAVVGALRALGISTGLIHVEFWLGADLVLGELHARPGGDFIHALTEYSRPGLQLFGMLLDDLLGRPVAEAPPRTRAAGSDYLVFPPGRLKGVHGWAAATAPLAAAALLVQPGSELGPVLSSEDRHAVLVADGASLDDVERSLTRAARALRVEVV